MKKTISRPAQVVLSRQARKTDIKQNLAKERNEQCKNDAHQKRLTKLRNKVNLGHNNNAHLGKDNIAMSDVSTDTEDSDDESPQGREEILTINCGPAGALIDIGFELMGGRTYDDDDYDDPGIYVQDVTEGHDVSNTIEAGDQVVKIGGHSVLDVPLHHAINLLRAANSRVVIKIIKHPNNLLGPKLPDESDDDSGPATSIQLDEEEDLEAMDEDLDDKLDGLEIPRIDAGLEGGLFLATLAVNNLDTEQASRLGSTAGSRLGIPQESLRPGSRLGSTAGSRLGVPQESPRPGSRLGSIVGSRFGVPQESLRLGSLNGPRPGSVMGSNDLVERSRSGSIGSRLNLKEVSPESKSSSLTRGVNASSSAVDETDGGEEVDVDFFSGRPGQLDDLDFEFAGGKDAPFISRNGGIFITKVKFGSVLEELISPGDKIIRLEGIDVTNVPQFVFINLLRASHGKATMRVRKAIKQKVNASVFHNDIEVSVNALGAQDELIIEIKTGPRGHRGQIGFKITGGRDKPCKPGDPGVFVKSVKPGSKLEKILKPGDKLLKVDGKNVTQATQGQVMDLIKKADTRVLLHIKRSLLDEEEERKKGRTISESFDAAQLQEFMAAYEMYSNPIDNKMRIGDLRKLCRALGFNLSGQDIEAMITEFKDKNPDAHFILFPEFLEMITKFSMYIQKDADILEAFEIFDRERSGFFYLDELKRAFQSMPGYASINEEEVKEIMEMADSNGDGKVYYQDFKALVLPIFQKY